MGLFKVFYVVGIPITLLASLLILFGLSASSGQKTFLDFAYLGFMFRQIDPYFWSALGVAFAIGLSVIGAAWCVA
jgi:V-type H+-transporting ATPase proteolipid subunit